MKSLSAAAGTVVVPAPPETVHCTRVSNSPALVSRPWRSTRRTPSAIGTHVAVNALDLETGGPLIGRPSPASSVRGLATDAVNAGTSLPTAVSVIVSFAAHGT